MDNKSIFYNHIHYMYYTNMYNFFSGQIHMGKNGLTHATFLVLLLFPKGHRLIFKQS